MPTLLNLDLDWRVLAIRGIAGVLFGIIALLMPGVTLTALTVLFGVYALISGLVSLIAAFRAGHRYRLLSAFLVEGVIGILAAAATFMWPALTLLILLYLIAGWAVVSGVFEIIAAVELRRIIRREWLLVFAGIASILFGVLLFAEPGAGALVIALWLGAYALVFGFLILGLSFRVRHWSHIVPPQAA